MLDDDYLAAAEMRARRFQGQWHGTSGSLAADVVRLLREREKLMSTTAELEAANAELRANVESRYVPAAEAACCEGGPMSCEASCPPELASSDWILRGEKELREQRKAESVPQVRFVGDSLLAESHETPAEQLLEKARQTVRQRRTNYGPPTNHFEKTVGMINAAFSEVLNRPLTPADWAIIMTLDKIARHQGPSKTADTPIDLAGYAACLAECEHATPATD